MTTRAAEAAAREDGGVPTVRVLDLVDLDQQAEAAALLASVWQTPGDHPPVPADVLRALAHTGGYVSGAYLEGRMVGAAVGFLTGDGALHSHVAGVVAGARGLGVGACLKHHQRRWARARGIAVVQWTFDPLVRRNAWFNLTKLGAVADEYLPLFYGDLPDEIDAGDESDRLLARWHVDGARARAAAAGDAAEPSEPDLVAAGAVVVLEDHDGVPVPAPVPGGAPVLLRVPRDVASLRRSDPAAALRWRRSLREVLQPLVEEGRTVVGMTRSGCYVVTGARA